MILLREGTRVYGKKQGAYGGIAVGFLTLVHAVRAAASLPLGCLTLPLFHYREDNLPLTTVPLTAPAL